MPRMRAVRSNATSGCGDRSGARCRDGTIRADELAERVQLVFHRLWASHRRSEITETYAGGLTSAQLAVLSVLVTDGPTRVSDLAASLRVRKPSITVGVQRLMRLGLVTRSAGSSPDQREVHIDITARGLGLFRKAQTERNKRVIGTLMRLSAEDRDVLRGALPLLRKLAEAAVAGYEPSDGCSEQGEIRSLAGHGSNPCGQA